MQLRRVPASHSNAGLELLLETAVFCSLGKSFCTALGLDGFWIVPQEQVHVQAACLSAASSKRVVFLVFSFARSAQPDGLFSNALCVGWMCVWRSCQLHEKEERAKERKKRHLVSISGNQPELRPCSKKGGVLKEKLWAKLKAVEKLSRLMFSRQDIWSLLLL